MAHENFIRSSGYVYTDHNGNPVYGGTGTTYINTTMGRIGRNPYISYSQIFNEMSKIFNLDLTPDQLNKLNELYDTGDSANQLIAANLFKYMLDKNKENAINLEDKKDGE